MDRKAELVNLVHGGASAVKLHNIGLLHFYFF